MSSQETNHFDNSDIVGRALDEMLAAGPDEREVAAAAARVWSRLAAATQTVHIPQTLQTPLDIAPAATLGAANSSPQGAALTGTLTGCDGFRADVPAYLRGELSPARALLLEDHTRECLPCRRALRDGRQHQAAGSAIAAPASNISRVSGVGGVAAGSPISLASRRPSHRATWLAAAALLALSLVTGLLWRYLGWSAPAGSMARLQTVEGQIYRVAGATSVALTPGDAIAGDEEVRTAKGSRAVLRMTDGSLIEMGDRASLSLAASRAGNTLDLARGRIIVQAAKQRPHHLYVATADCLVSVTGTIFEVNHGVKGSRVSVVEGEVHVRQARLGAARTLSAANSAGSSHPLGDAQEAVLRPGQQVSTDDRVTAVPVAAEVAWSHDAARYQALLAELTAAGQAIDQQVGRPAVRTASHLLDLVPAGTLFYVAFPNLSANLTQTEALFEQRLAQSPVLEAWWSETMGSPANEALFHQLIQEVGDVGQSVGDEVVIAAGSAAQAAAGSGTAFSGAGAPVLLAQATDESALKASLEHEAQLINQRQGHVTLVVLDQLPSTIAAPPPAGTPQHQLLAWVGQGLLIASPSAAQIATIAASAASANVGGATPGAVAASVNPFVASSFHARLAQAYADGGAGWLIGADLQQMIAAQRAAHAQSPARLTEAMGLFDLQHFILERHDSPAAAAGQPSSGTDTRASLTFSQQRRGIASWLAAPAPLGSLGFFSADVNLVAAFAVKSPVELLDEITALSPQLAAGLKKEEAAHGFDLRSDLAAPLGGEIALGLDGPMLPTPSWKLVVEVYDPTHLQQTIAGAVAEANSLQVAAGRPGITLTSQVVGGQTIYTIAPDLSGSSTSLAASLFQVCYLYADGYLVAAPTPAALSQALAQRAAGTTLAASSRLRSLLGRDGQVNVSALVYQNLPNLVKSFGSAAAQIAAPHASSRSGGNPLARLWGASGASGPSLLYAYAEPERIVFAGHSDAGPMGLNLETLASFGGVLGTISRAHAAAAAHGAPDAPETPGD